MITLTNVPAFADRLKAQIEVEGLGTLTVDVAFGGDSFVLADATSLGFAVTADEARELAMTGRKIAEAANAQLGFRHPVLTGWNHISFCFMTGALERENGILTSRNGCVVNPGKIDRSPTGTGCSALMAVLHAKGLLSVGETYIGRSIIESRFIGRVEELTAIAGKPAIVPSISGRAWITGSSSLMLDPDDPWPAGYKISDTWPMPSK